MKIQVPKKEIKFQSNEITVRQKSMFAVQHLLAAARFSRQCGKIQLEHMGESLGSFHSEMTACVSATVMLSVASLESNINEHLSDPDNIFGNLPKYIRNELSVMSAEMQILEKYQKILIFNNLSPFERGKKPYQDVSDLIQLRNELVHFHPEWHDIQKRHKNLGNRLRNKFELSPFIKEDSDVIFPPRIISHGCTKWAVKSSLSFMENFEELLKLESKFKKIYDQLEA